MRHATSCGVDAKMCHKKNTCSLIKHLKNINVTTLHGHDPPQKHNV